MKSYNLKWDERLKKIILYYAEVRKVYIDDIDKINLIAKNKIYDDPYHIYKYNDSVNYLIKDIKVENNKIIDMVVFLLSNSLEEIASVYYKLRDEVHFGINCLTFMYNFESDNKLSYFFDDNIGIIKNYERCINNKNFMLSDIHKLSNITKLSLKDGYYYINDNKYLSLDDYNKYTNKFFNGIKDKESYVVLKHIGPYKNIYKTYNKLLKLIKEEKRKIIGLPMEQFVCGRWNEKDENKYVTNIMIPIN